MFEIRRAAAAAGMSQDILSGSLSRPVLRSRLSRQCHQRRLYVRVDRFRMADNPLGAPGLQAGRLECAPSLIESDQLKVDTQAGKTDHRRVNQFLLQKSS